MNNGNLIKHQEDHTENFTQISNFALQKSGLTLRAMGMRDLLLSLPPTWQTTVSGLCVLVEDTAHVVEQCLKELKAKGYLEIIRINPGESGSNRVLYEWHIYETPQPSVAIRNIGSVKVQTPEIQGSENQRSEIQKSEKWGLK